MHEGQMHIDNTRKNISVTISEYLCFIFKEGCVQIIALTLHLTSTLRDWGWLTYALIFIGIN